MNAQVAGPYDLRTRPAGGIDDDAPARWPEGNWFTCRHGDYELILSRRDVSDRQTSAIRRGEAEFALAIDGPLVLLCFRFGVVFPWAHVLYSVQHMPTGDRASSPTGPPPAERTLLSILLVESVSVQTRATRVVTLSMDLTRALHESIRAQGRRLMAPGTQERATERMLRQGLAADSLLERSIARGLGSL